MASKHPVYPNPGPSYSTVRSSDVYRCREAKALYNAYTDASLAINCALQEALGRCVEVSGVSVDEQDAFIRGARDLLDDLFNAAAERLDDQGVDGDGVLYAARCDFPFDDERAAIQRESVRRASLSSGNGEGL